MVRQGTAGAYAQEMIEAGFMGVDFIGDHDLGPLLAGGPATFRLAVSELFRQENPDSGKIATSQGVNTLWRAAEGIAEGDLIVAAPATGGPDWHYGTVAGYAYHQGTRTCRAGDGSTGRDRSAGTTRVKPWRLPPSSGAPCWT